MNFCGINIQTSTVDAFEVPRLDFIGKMKLIMGLIFLFPIRLILILISCLIIIILYIMIIPLINPIDQPQNRFVRCIVWTICKVWGRGVMFLFGYYIVREKGELNEKAKIIICGPHSSSIDMFFCLYKFAPSFAVAEFLTRNPFLKHLAKITNCLVIDRKQSGSSEQFVHDLKRRVNFIDEQGRQFPRVVVFPEGATGNGRSLNYFHTGAFLPGEPIQVCILKYIDDLNWTQWSVRNWVFHFSTIMCQLSNRLEVTYLPLYYPSVAEIEHPKLFAYNVKYAMAMKAQLTCTDLRYQDREEYEQCRKEIIRLGFKVPQPKSAEEQFRNAKQPLISVDPDSIDEKRAIFHSTHSLPSPQILKLIEAPQREKPPPNYV